MTANMKKEMMKIKTEAMKSNQMTTNSKTAIATTGTEVEGIAQEGGIKMNTESLSKPWRNMEKIGEKSNNMSGPEVQHKQDLMRKNSSKDLKNNI